MPYQYFTVILGLHLFVKNCEPLNWNWKIDKSFDGKINLDRHFINYSISSMPLCAQTCIEWENCTSFFYNCEGRWCNVQSTVFSSLYRATPSKGTSYFRLNSDVCPMDRGYYLDRVSGLCVKIFIQNVPRYSQARELCGNSSGRLITLETPAKYLHLRKFFLQYIEILNAPSDGAAWLGAGKVKDGYQWITGGPVLLTGARGHRWPIGVITILGTEECLGLKLIDENIFQTECETFPRSDFMVVACEFDITSLK